MKKPMYGRVAGGLLAFALVVPGAAPATAQVALSPRALGMAGGFEAIARGQEAVFLNPALLGLPGTPFWSIAFPQVTVGATLLGTEFGDLQPMTRYRRVSPQQRDEILARIPPEGTEMRLDARLPLAVVQIGHLGVGLAYTAVGQHTVGRDVMELLFDGYQEGRTDYAVGDTRGSRATYWDLAAAYGFTSDGLSLGATAHYYRGGVLVRSRMMEPTFDPAARDIEVEYRTVMARGGRGYGVDVGAAMQASPSITLSASLSNVLSRMSWSEDLRMRSLTLNRDDIQNVSAMDLLTRYETSETTVAPPGVSLEDYAAAEGLYDTNGLPSVLRLGAAWSGASGTDLGVNYRNQRNDSALGEIWGRSLGMGVQQRIPYATVRAGYATNLDGGRMTSGGLSLGVLQFGVARLRDGDVDGFDRSGWVATFGVSVETSGTVR